MAVLKNLALRHPQVHLRLILLYNYFDLLGFMKLNIFKRPCHTLFSLTSAYTGQILAPLSSPNTWYGT